jgi:hypothetical protein
MNNETRDFLNKIIRGELEETSARKKASEILEKYTLLALWNETHSEHIEKDFTIIKISYDEDYQNSDLLLVRRKDAPMVKKYLQEAYEEFLPEDEDDATAKDLQEKYTYLHNYIEKCLDNHSDIPHSWITYDDMDFDTGNRG